MNEIELVKKFWELFSQQRWNEAGLLLHAFPSGDQVLTTVWIEADTGQKTYANSIFQFKDGKILSAEEYWAEPTPAPEWRSQWVEAL